MIQEFGLLIGYFDHFYLHFAIFFFSVSICGLWGALGWAVLCNFGHLDLYYNKHELLTLTTYVKTIRLQMSKSRYMFVFLFIVKTFEKIDLRYSVYS